MFLQFWILFMIVGLTISMWVFYWAVRKGQFEEQDRAKYLPLLHPPQTNNTTDVLKGEQKFVWSPELISLLIAMFLALTAIARMLYIVFTN